MPANLPPQYFEAEKRYRLAKSFPEKMEALDNMLAIMPKHKGTDKLRADLRRRLAKLSEEAEKKHALGRRGGIYPIRKEGAGQVVLVGLPNVGKSQLVSAITKAALDVADYPFTTQVPTPGMMKLENIQIQLVDMPPITDSAARPWLSVMLRSADVLLLVVDLADNPAPQLETVIAELEGLRVGPPGRQPREEAATPLIQKKCLIVGNKNDLGDSGRSYQALEAQYGGEFPMVSISAKEGTGLEGLRGEIYRTLDIIRVYTKAPGGKADLAEPVVLRKGSTVEDLAGSIHKDFRYQLKYAQIWGSGKYDGQRVKRGHHLEDGDVIELHL